MEKDLVAMLCLTSIAIMCMYTKINHDTIMLIIGGLISLGGVVVGEVVAKR